MKTVDMKFMKKTLLVKVLQYQQNCIRDFLKIFCKNITRIELNEKVRPF